MAEVILRLRARRDLAANWTSSNPTLGNGEVAWETDTGLLKIGDGVTAWTSLAYWGTFDTIQVNDTLTVTGLTTLNDDLAVNAELIHMSGTAPELRFTETDAGVDQGIWYISPTAEALQIGLKSDILGTDVAINIERSGTGGGITVDEIAMFANAGTIRLQSDTVTMPRSALALVLGAATATTPIIRRSTDIGSLQITGGISSTAGARITAFGGGHVSFANDMAFGAGSDDDWMNWDDSAGSLTLSTGIGATKTAAATFSDANVDIDRILQLHRAGGQQIFIGNAANDGIIEHDGSNFLIGNETGIGDLTLQNRRDGGAIRFNADDGGGTSRQIAVATAIDFAIQPSGTEAFKVEANLTTLTSQADIWGNILNFGADSGTTNTTRTNSTNKRGWISTPHWNNAEEDTLMLGMANASAINEIYIGGFTGFNAATHVHIYAAANNTTLLGSRYIEVDGTADRISLNADVEIPATDRIYFGTGDSAWITESIAETLSFATNSTERMTLNGAGDLTILGTGTLTTAASTASGAGLKIPEGLAPSAPVDGDVWVTAAGEFFTRLNGVSVDLAAGVGTIGGSITDNQVAIGATTANDIEGSTALLFDGSILTVDATLPVLALDAGPSSVSSLDFNESGTTRASIQYVGAVNEIRINSGDAETLALTIDSNQHVIFAQKAIFDASTTADPSFNIPEGVAPTTPVDGDVWVTAAGEFFARLNGVSVDLSAPGAGIGGSIADNQIAVGAVTANDIEGSSSLAWDDTNVSIGSVATNTYGFKTLGSMSFAIDSGATRTDRLFEWGANADNPGFGWDPLMRLDDGTGADDALLTVWGDALIRADLTAGIGSGSPIIAVDGGLVNLDVAKFQLKSGGVERASVHWLEFSPFDVLRIHSETNTQITIGAGQTVAGAFLATGYSTQFGIKMSERADHPTAPVGGSGEIWVRDLGVPFDEALVYTEGANGIDYLLNTVLHESAAATLTLSPGHHTIVGTLSGNQTFTLPTAVGAKGKLYYIKKTGATGTLTVDTTSTQTIDGASSVAMATQYDELTVQSDNANWVIVAQIDGAAGGGGLFTEDADDNIVGGTGAGAALTAASALGNFLAGINAGSDITTGDYNVVIGQDAGRGIVAVLDNVVIGHNALGNIAGVAGAANVAIGHGAMNSSVISGADNNVAIGRDTLDAISSGDENVAIGELAGTGLTTGLRNVIIGSNAGTEAITGQQNVIIGYTAGGVTSGDQNIVIGQSAGPSTGSVDRQLFIDNVKTNTPLIHGNFTTQVVTINGDFFTPENTQPEIDTTSGTAHEWTSIPTNARKVILAWSGLSTNGTSIPIVQLGTPGYKISGYLGSVARHDGTDAQGNHNTGFAIDTSWAAATVSHGMMTIMLVDDDTQIYAMSGSSGNSNNNAHMTFAGSVDMVSRIQSIRLTTVNGTDTFDAGVATIRWE